MGGGAATWKVLRVLVRSSSSASDDTLVKLSSRIAMLPTRRSWGSFEVPQCRQGWKRDVQGVLTGEECGERGLGGDAGEKGMLPGTLGARQSSNQQPCGIHISGRGQAAAVTE